MGPAEFGRLSRMQADVLAWLHLHAARDFAVVELAVDLGMPTSVVAAELQPMVAAELVSCRPTASGAVYRASTAHASAAELAEYLAVTRGPARVVGEEFAAMADVELVLLLGDWTGGPAGTPAVSPRGVDLLVVGSPSAVAVAEAAERAEQRLDLPVNTVVRTSEQWAIGVDPLVAGVRRSGYVTVRRAGRPGPTSGSGRTTSVAT